MRDDLVTHGVVYHRKEYKYYRFHYEKLSKFEIKNVEKTAQKKCDRKKITTGFSI